MPTARVWPGPGAAATTLAEAVAGEGHALLCFYPFDWSPGWTNELLHLRARSDELSAAGVRVFGISLDSPWSQRAFAESLALREVTLLSDALGEAAAGFGVLGDSEGIPKALRSAFLLGGDTVVASWMLGSDLPDVDAIVAAASSS